MYGPFAQQLALHPAVPQASWTGSEPPSGTASHPAMRTVVWDFESFIFSKQESPPGREGITIIRESGAPYLPKDAITS